MKKRFTIPGGGFHNVTSITVMGTPDPIDKGFVWLSKKSWKRVQKHFCGMSDCVCCSWPTEVDWNRDGSVKIHIPENREGD